MPLMRAFIKVDKEGKIPLPKNFRREAKMEPGQMVEIKLHGNPSSQWLTVHKREAAR